MTDVRDSNSMSTLSEQSPSMHLNLTDDEDRERGPQMDPIVAWGSRCPLEALEGLFTGVCGSYCSARQPLQPDD